jgi:hypothetical protein
MWNEGAGSSDKNGAPEKNPRVPTCARHSSSKGKSKPAPFTMRRVRHPQKLSILRGKFGHPPGGRPGFSRSISLSLLPLTRPQKRRQAAALQTEPRCDSVERRSLLPLSEMGAIDL